MTLFLFASEVLKADHDDMCGGDKSNLYCKSHDLDAPGEDFYNTIVLRGGTIRHLGCSICDDHSDVYLEDGGSVAFRFRFRGHPEHLPVIALATQPGQWKDLF